MWKYVDVCVYMVCISNIDVHSKDKMRIHTDDINTNKHKYMYIYNIDIQYKHLV